MKAEIQLQATDSQVKDAEMQVETYLVKVVELFDKKEIPTNCDLVEYLEKENLADKDFIDNLRRTFTIKSPDYDTDSKLFSNNNRARIVFHNDNDGLQRLTCRADFPATNLRMYCSYLLLL